MEKKWKKKWVRLGSGFTEILNRLVIIRNGKKFVYVLLVINFKNKLGRQFAQPPNYASSRIYAKVQMGEKHLPRRCTMIRRKMRTLLWDFKDLDVYSFFSSLFTVSFFLWNSISFPSCSILESFWIWSSSSLTLQNICSNSAALFSLSESYISVCALWDDKLKPEVR